MNYVAVPGAPSRPSELAMNPDNDRARAERRAHLLNAFLRLDPVIQADALELVERTANCHGDMSQTYRWDFRKVRDALYGEAGW